MAINFKNEANADLANLLGAVHADVACMVLEVGGITVGRNSGASCT